MKLFDSSSRFGKFRHFLMNEVNLEMLENAITLDSVLQNLFIASDLLKTLQILKFLNSNILLFLNS